MGSDFLDEINRPNDASTFYKFGAKKDGLELYCHKNAYQIFFESNAFICPLFKDKFPEKEIKEIKKLKRKDVNFFKIVYNTIGTETASYCKKLVEDYDRMINEEEEEYLKLYIINIYALKLIKKFIYGYTLDLKSHLLIC